MIRKLYARWRRYLARREEARRGWLGRECDGCDGALEAPSYVLRLSRGEFRIACPGCSMEWRAAGAEILRVLT